MGNFYSIYRFSYHIFSDNTVYLLIAKRILHNILHFNPHLLFHMYDLLNIPHLAVISVSTQ